LAQDLVLGGRTRLVRPAAIMLEGFIAANLFLWKQMQIELFPRMLPFLLFFVIVQSVSRLCIPHGWTLASRPTVVAGSIHGVSISIIALLVSLGEVDLSWWRRVGLPLTTAYNMSDMLFYCIPKKKMLFVLHHFTIVYCHSGVCSEAAAAFFVGDAVWGQRLSALGFLSEIPVPVMNLRWYVHRAWKTSVRAHAAINMACVVSWIIFRIVLFPCLVYFELLPRQAAFRAADRLDVFITCIIGHVLIFLMSFMWLIELIRTITVSGSKSPNE